MASLSTIQMLAHKALSMRKLSILATTQAGGGHPTSCLSAADLVACTFFHAMRFDPQNPSLPNNDRFILSKGHAAPLLYAAWHEAGVLSQEELMTLRDINSPLEGHPTPRFNRSEAATGSLGNGLGIGLGMALSTRYTEHPFNVFVLLGDSELAEGSIWEAANLAQVHHASNLIALVDANRLGQTGPTIEGHNLTILQKRFESFGWHTQVIDGHDLEAITDALDTALAMRDKPSVIIAQTYKGYGVSLAQDKLNWHGKPFSADDISSIFLELEKTFAMGDYYEDNNEHTPWQPHLPEPINQHHEIKPPLVTLPEPTYDLTDTIATRKAYGYALIAAGLVCNQVIVLDAEVKNSTYAELFEQQFPNRFIECHVAEQNMVNMAIGLAARGLLPFVSTFAAFFSRAFDQIRMAEIGKANIRLVGSHAGVSIGSDGPSQMGLEDIALMRTLPNAIVLYPSDAVSTYHLIEQMANYPLISYLRTTRAQTPIIYANNTRFVIGGCHVIHQTGDDDICLIGAGITLHEALKAHELLKLQGIKASVIDLYSIKPLDRTTVLATARLSSNRILTIEDHYAAGGIGEAVMSALHGTNVAITCLAVPTVPQSGSPEDLLKWAHIDAESIACAAQKIVS